MLTDPNALAEVIRLCDDVKTLAARVHRQQQDHDRALAQARRSGRIPAKDDRTPWTDEQWDAWLQTLRQYPAPRTRDTATLRRRSMDLTHALAALRSTR